jgi:hypothetical protein
MRWPTAFWTTMVSLILNAENNLHIFVFCHNGYLKPGMLHDDQNLPAGHRIMKPNGVCLETKLE